MLCFSVSTCVYIFMITFIYKLFFFNYGHNFFLLPLVGTVFFLSQSIRSACIVESFT